jgi:hypothetical protein
MLKKFAINGVKFGIPSVFLLFIGSVGGRIAGRDAVPPNPPNRIHLQVQFDRGVTLIPQKDDTIYWDTFDSTNPRNLHINFSPGSAPCDPSTSTPITCVVTLNYGTGVFPYGCGNSYPCDPTVGPLSKGGHGATSPARLPWFFRFVSWIDIFALKSLGLSYLLPATTPPPLPKPLGEGIPLGGPAPATAIPSAEGRTEAKAAGRKQNPGNVLTTDPQNKYFVDCDGSNNTFVETFTSPNTHLTEIDAKVGAVVYWEGNNTFIFPAPPQTVCSGGLRSDGSNSQYYCTIGGPPNTSYSYTIKGNTAAGMTCSTTNETIKVTP